MVEKANVFPPRSLPGIAENWGRHVEQRIELGEKSEVQLAQKVDNGLRANEGVLTTLSSQVNELFERSPKSVSSNEYSSVLVNAGSMGSWGWGSASTVSLPFEITAPREVQVSYSGYMSLSIESGGGVIMGGFRTVYFTSPPVPGWSNASYVQNDLFDVRQAANPSSPSLPGTPLSYIGMSSGGSSLRLTPGIYRVGTVLWVGVSGSAGTQGRGIANHLWEWNTVVPSGVLTVTPGGPDPSITTSDIPQYTP